MSFKHRLYLVIVLCTSMVIALILLDKHQTMTLKNEQINKYNRSDILQINKELKAAEIVPEERLLPSTLKKKEEKAAAEAVATP